MLVGPLPRSTVAGEGGEAYLGTAFAAVVIDSTATAKNNPTISCPLAFTVAMVFMPITSPRNDTSGPPLLPGFKGASVWTYGPPWMVRCAEYTPRVIDGPPRRSRA